MRLFSNSGKEPYLLLYKILGFYPDKIEYYQLALRHRSVAVPTENGNLLNNERLEFLGDAVLNSVVTDILFRRYENQREGFLTNTRSKIVRRDSLNHLALEMGLDKLMQTTKHVNTHTNNNIYGNALEALLGAIYLDYGYKRCKKFVEFRLFKHFIDIDKIAADEENFKSKIIEWAQKNKVDLQFDLVAEQLNSGNKHLFQTKLLIGGVDVCEGFGPNKKESQQNAAKEALRLIYTTPRFLENILHSQEAMTSESEILS